MSMQFQTQNSTQSADTASAINFDNLMEDIEKQQAASSAIVSALLSEFEELLGSHGLSADDLSDADIEALKKAGSSHKDEVPANLKEKAQEVLAKFEGVQEKLQKIVDTYQENHQNSPDLHLGSASQNPFAVMAEIMAQVNQAMADSNNKFAQLDSQMLQDQFLQEEQDYKNAEKKHGPFHHFVKSLEYVAQATACACVAIIAPEVAAVMAVTFLMMDTGAIGALDKEAEKAMPAVAAKALVAAGFAALSVATLGAADAALAAGAVEEVGTIVVEEAGSELMDFAAEEGSEALSQAGSEGEQAVEEKAQATVEEKVENKTESKAAKKTAKSNTKKYVGTAVMSLSSGLLQDNFAAAATKDIHCTALRDTIFGILTVAELAGAIAGGGAAISGVGSEEATANTAKVSELIQGTLGGSAESAEELSETIQTIATGVNSVDKGMQASMKVVEGGYQIHIAKLMEQIQELNIGQNISRNSLKDVLKFSKEFAQSIDQMFQQLNFGAAAQAVANVLGNGS